MNMTKKETWQAIIGFISAIVWMFGAKAQIPAEAIAFAQATLIGVIGHVLGSSNSEPSVTIEATEAQSPITQQGETK